MTHMNDIADGAGAGTAVTAAILWGVDQLKLADVNDVLLTFTALGGFVWMVYRVVLIRVQTKGERLENERREYEIKKMKEDDEKRD